jgi:hypothetical protein
MLPIVILNPGMLTLGGIAGSILQIEPKRLGSGYKPEPAVLTLRWNCFIEIQLIDFNNITAL